MKISGCNNVTTLPQCYYEPINYPDIPPRMQAEEVEAEQPSLDVSTIELSERLRRIRNPSNLALLATFPRDKKPIGVTLDALLEHMAITGKRFDEAVTE